MSQLMKDLNYYLFGFRWIVFLISLLYYMGNFPYQYTVLIGLIILNLIYTILLFYPLNRQTSLFLIGAELLLDYILLYKTGVWNSPFLLYTLSTFLWLNIFWSGKKFFSLFIFYFSTLATLKLLIDFPSPEASEILMQKYMLQLFAFFGFVFLLNQFFRAFKKEYRRGMVVYRYIKTLAEKKDLQSSKIHTEGAISKLFAIGDIYVLSFTDSKEKDLLRNSYTKLIQAGKYTKGNHPNEIVVRNYAGEKERLFYFPVKSASGVIGAVVYPLRKGMKIKRYEYLYLYLIGKVLANKERELLLEEENAKSLKEDFRKKMAQDMHDGIAQQLFFLNAMLFKLKMNLPEERSGNVDQILQDIEKQVKGSHQEIRDYIKDLRDEGKKEHIFDAIDQLVKRLTADKGLTVRFHTSGQPLNEDPDTVLIIYRFVQESLNNTLKHAKATSIEISLEVTQVQWSIHILDNGIGFDEELTNTKKESLGLIGMSERINEAGGTMSVNSNLGTGTKITAILPRGRVKAHG
ncbi:sensor histidine kinase [Rossellomorea vietnamensis]